MLRFRDDLENELEEKSEDEEGLTLGDDTLEELDSDDAAGEDDAEAGFGHLGEDGSEDKDDEEEDDEELPLEEDAEDVDYDTFDDIDEM